MSKGFIVLAQNNGETDYVRQAYLLAKSIQTSQRTTKNITLVTNDLVPEEYKSVFDNIVEIPFGDQALNSEWKVENRWKLYHASPYEETIVFDADMLVTQDLTHCWRFVKDKDLFFTSTVTDYKGNVVTDITYRKMFVENNLPNLYSGMFYFKKSDNAKEFFKVLEYISYNWERFFFEIAPKQMQKFFSIDVAIAIAVKILDIEEQVSHVNSPFKFIHMKPALQGWTTPPLSCYSQIQSYYNRNDELYVGNFKQVGVFHYVENEFLTLDVTENING